MNIRYDICIGLSMGVLAGFAVGGIKSIFFREAYSEARVLVTRRFVGKLAAV